MTVLRQKREFFNVLRASDQVNISWGVEDLLTPTSWYDSICANTEKIPQTGEERFYYLTAYLLNHDCFIKLDELSEFLFVSRGVLTPCIREVEAYLERYGIIIERKPGYGIRASGTEYEIRHCLRDLFFNQMSRETGIKNVLHQELKDLADMILPQISQYNIHLSEMAFETLVQDIYVQAHRIKHGRYVTFEKEEPLPLNESEREFLRQALSLLSDHYGIEYTEPENYYLAIHLAGKKTLQASEIGDENFVIREEIDQLTGKMLDSIYENMQLDLRRNLELRMALDQHMVTLDIRLRYDIPLNNPETETISHHYPLGYTVATWAAAVLQNYYQKEISEDEIAYLALLFAVSVEDQRQATPKDKMRILIVCMTGNSAARLLRHRYLQEFPQYIEEIYTCDTLELEYFDFRLVDYVFTTVPIDCYVPKPIQEISLFPQEHDMELVGRLLRDNGVEFLKKYYKKENFLTGQLGETREEIVRNMCRVAVERDGLPEGLYESVMKREMIMATDYGSEVAIPHPANVMTDETYVYVAVLDHAVPWSRRKVRVVILTIIGQQEDEDLQKYYEVTTDFLADDEAVRKLCETPTYEAFIDILQNQ